jgi:hypothetical protein
MEQQKKTIDSSKDAETRPVQNDPKKDFENMVTQYLENVNVMSGDRKNSELEIRFGTNPRVSKPISKIDYDNVVSKLYSVGFTTGVGNREGLHILRIQNEYTDFRTGLTKISNTRAEIVGVDLIQEYCKSNSIQKVLDMPSTISAASDKLKFTQKSPPRAEGGKNIRNVDFADFNFRVSYQLEQDFMVKSNTARNIINNWSDSKKLFRHINRVRFAHPDIPVFGDLSIVKSSKRTGKIPIPQYTIQDAGVFQSQEQYEIELEVDNSRVGMGTPYNTPEKILAAIRKCIRFVLGALQGTNYPIAYSEMDRTLQSYMKMIHGDEYQERRIMPKDFIGPSSYTLQVEHIVPENEVTNVPNIRHNYTVTEKADGERKLLYISSNGRIYMIDTNMKVIFTGAMTNEKTIYDSLLDGEHIKFDKKHKFINLFAAFDIYYVNKKSVREHAFILSDEEIEKLSQNPDKNTNMMLKHVRLLLLKKCINVMKPISILDGGLTKNEDADVHNPCRFYVKCKEFYMDSPDMSIFQACSTILSNVKDGLFEYNTDGLIFTPSNTGVGSDRMGVAGPLYKSSWDQSLKWKPVEFNTIDFLVSIKKDKTGRDEIHHIFQEGKNTAGIQDIVQYKTLVLRCGFDERKHGYLNPMQDMIDNKIPSPGDIDNEETYKPVPFQPTNPYDPMACFCNINVYENGNGDLIMKTEEHEYFEEDMIVEFRYDASKEGAWKWVPLRVRYDKTSELRAGLRNYGNAYHVANTNWHSIHNPVTNEMISTGLNIPEYSGDEDVYYNRSTADTSTRSLRDFHNLFVKRKLIMGVSNRRDTLIDFAVGKGGDMPKWIHAKLAFVFGIDISKDNINNHLDGACARYLNASRRNRDMPGALFVVGNSGLNIRSGEAINTEKEKQITNAVFGTGPKERKLLGEGVYKYYGVGHDGFQISSCQFALHYFFENALTLHKFVQNVADCTRLGGYFIGTCYDGRTVFNLLKNKNPGEGFTIMNNEKKIYEISKIYNQTGFPDDELSLGYAIDVYQESINKVFREYLVNFEYFIRVMENYGFVVLPRKDAEKMDLPDGTGLFNDLFRSMDNEIRRNPSRETDYGTALKMTANEKTISYMNRYFIFHKVHTVNSKKVAKIGFDLDEKDMEPEKVDKDVMTVGQAVGPIAGKQSVPDAAKKPAARKLKRPKMELGAYEAVTDIPVDKPVEPSVDLPVPKPVFGEMITLKLKRPVKKATGPAPGPAVEPVPGPASEPAINDTVIETGEMVKIKVSKKPKIKIID